MKVNTKNKIRNQVFQLTKQLLVLLAESPGVLLDIFIKSDPNLRKIFFDKEITRRQLNRSLRDLEKQRLVRKKRSRGKIIYEVTDLGRARILKWNYKRKKKKERRDGSSTIVIFDIPETKKKSRDFLRRFLKENDFTQLQKSVFIGRFYLLDEFYTLLKEVRIEDHVSVLEGRVLYRDSI